MAFTGPYPTKFSGHTSAMVISATTFSGGVTNTGTIGPGGISVVSGAFLSGGGILDTGTIGGGIKIDSSSKIVASGGATQTAVAVENTATFGGGISNAGVISAAIDGILVASISIFSGGIHNNGTIAVRATPLLSRTRPHSPAASPTAVRFPEASLAPFSSATSRAFPAASSTRLPVVSARRSPASGQSAFPSFPGESSTAA